MDQYSEKTGLDWDCINVWSILHSTHDLSSLGHMQKDKFVERLTKPIEKYYEYLNRAYPDKIDEHRLRALPGLVDTFDNVINEYNLLSLEDKMKDFAHRPYWERCREIIKG
jgi:hypothetical protein